MATIVDGFTPCPDELVLKYGLIVAAVWGKIFRYEQMDDRVCFAAQGRLASELNISIRAVGRHLKTLHRDGYISKKVRPQGKTDIYNTTNKIVMKVSATPNWQNTSAGLAERPTPNWQTKIGFKKQNNKKQSLRDENQPTEEGQKEIRLRERRDREIAEERRLAESATA